MRKAMIAIGTALLVSGGAMAQAPFPRLGGHSPSHRGVPKT